MLPFVILTLRECAMISRRLMATSDPVTLKLLNLRGVAGNSWMTEQVPVGHWISRSPHKVLVWYLAVAVQDP